MGKSLKRLPPFLFLLVFFASLGMVTSAAAEKRVALVIGNGNYPKTIGALRNPVNDAMLMASTLRRLKFDVIETIDSSQVGMKRAISTFGKRLNKAGKDGVGLFYYAGHGVQVNGANYLIPIDAQIEIEGDVDLYAVNANSVLRMMEFSGARLSFVILDACRNNPFARGFRSFNRGLARMDAPRGSLVAYATAPGNVATDGTGNNSPYTMALARGLMSGQPVERMFREVRNTVMRDTLNRQTPWEASSLTGGDFYFNPGKTGITKKPTATPSQSPPQGTLRPDMLAWETIRNSTSPDELKAFIISFPNSPFAALARAKRQTLFKQQQAALTPGPSVTPKSIPESMKGKWIINSLVEFEMCREYNHENTYRIEIGEKPSKIIDPALFISNDQVSIILETHLDKTLNFRLIIAGEYMAEAKTSVSSFKLGDVIRFTTKDRFESLRDGFDCGYANITIKVVEKL